MNSLPYRFCHRGCVKIPQPVPNAQRCLLILSRQSELPSMLVSMQQVRNYSGPPRNIMITVGTKDDFLDNQLKPDIFAMAASGTKVSVDLRLQVRLSSFVRYSGDILH